MSNKRDSLGDRMKTYENVSRNYLTRRTPVIIRCDMRAGHSFTKGFDKPYDKVFNNTMTDTMKYLCENIQNCVFGYTQSDEITLVLCDYKTLDTAAWFDNNIQKMASISASLATLAFNKYFLANYIIFAKEYFPDWDEGGTNRELNEEEKKVLKLSEVYSKAMDRGTTFDARVFNIPPEEVCNCLIWRQQDAIRNSIQGLGQKYFSQKQLEGAKCEDIKLMLTSLKEIDWNNIPLEFQRGTCCIKGKEKGWFVDYLIPLFTEDRNYINKWLTFEDSKS